VLTLANKFKEQYEQRERKTIKYLCYVFKSQIEINVHFYSLQKTKTNKMLIRVVLIFLFYYQNCIF